jgi:hypothetical protein
MNCQNCQHWRARTLPEYASPAGKGGLIGECDHPSFVTEQDITPVNGLRADSGYDYSTAQIWVGAEFGCIHFNAKS